MDFFTSKEMLISLVIEAGILLLVAIAVIVFLLFRLKRASSQSESSPAPKTSTSVLDYLRAEVEKTSEKQGKLGNNGEEAKLLQAACDLRRHVLEGEIRVLESTEGDTTHYWRPVLEYYEAIHADFAGKISMLEERLATSLQRIENLEKFKEKLFELRDRLSQVYQNNSRLEEELRAKLKQGVKLTELEHTLSQMEREKEDLAKELQLAENEFMAIMENAAESSTNALNSADGEVLVTLTEADKLKADLKAAAEENDFLCKQIQALLTQEVELTDKTDGREQEFLELEKRYAKMEERYLQLQDELDQKVS